MTRKLNQLAAWLQTLFGKMATLKFTQLSANMRE